MFKVIVAGSRTFDDFVLMRQKLDSILSRKGDQVEIVSGGARGADALGYEYAHFRQYTVTVMKAKWDVHGKKAGYLRNVDMAKYADALVAFWDGKSKGTGHMIDIAKKKGMPIRVINYTTEVQS